MLKIENVEVVGWEHAIRGMRNPKNSWERSDSFICEFGKSPDEIDEECNKKCAYHGECDISDNEPHFIVGPNDHKLMMSLSKGGPVHAKYRRFIDVYFDVVAPLYWWKEFETYRNVVADNPFDIEMNSCSTMHKIHEKQFELSDFSTEHLSRISLSKLLDTIDTLNTYRRLFVDWDKIDDNTKNAWDVHDRKDAWWQMIQLLPDSYNQRRTLKTSYESLAGMLEWREDHKQDEWRVLCKWIRSLPYSEIMDKNA